MVVKTSQLSKIYHLDGVEVRALVEVNMEIKEGEFIAIMGPSGSGKSTLLNLLGCLDTASIGEYWLDGVKVDKTINLANIRNQKIGFVFQSFNLLSRCDALHNVELPMMYAGVTSKNRQRKATELLEQVGIGNRLHHLPNQLSGGEKQRVAIARALANDPPLILADEPTGNLDSISGQNIMEILQNLNNQGRTIAMVTHDPNLGERADRIIKLMDGRIVS
ncbi:macrolide ABC transporter ATP-binding protein [candidate division WWE3 bacterium CG08_land_8_20_14_0_20_43_13]|uniref:Macrolide ABC transporter ATP-binding protein n=1 Tax=candidate division WWE3 bacterium CG08_land_8_20_14_0_20_43_13 TaxID=1975087 RepID=A0A2H0X7I6_UNCKA|nr:MAG: macrolide ABC transporter ATP-binding protein [candidate division WWE3 bacterium CG08_land_8_20_14_0_20_43_13]